MAWNANSGLRQEKPFRDALRMELAALKDDDPKALRAVARTLLETAASGDLQAIKEVADRTDGKAVQSVDADVTVTFEDILARLK